MSPLTVGHVACFNAATGDVEDAPAFEPLNTYPLSAKDGSVYITATEAAIKAFSRASNAACTAKDAASAPGVVIVGGGSGALGAVDGLRQHGYTGSVTVVSNEGYLPIDRPKLSKALITDVAKITLRDQAWYDAGNVKWVTGQVASVDFAARSVSTADGTSIPYSKLVLATGGTPRQLSLPGFDTLSNVFTLRTAADTKKITDAIGPDGGKKVVIVGSSFIGMEVANATLKNNSVTVIGMEKVPLERVLGEQVGAAVQASLEKKGITFHMNASVDSASDGAIVLKDGTKLPADVVILGVGVSPATEYLQGNAGITLEKDGSVKTDAHFLVDGHKDVYAVGDIATYPYRGPVGGNETGSSTKYTRIEHWNVAQNAGRTAATHIVDPSRAPANFIPVFWSALGAQLRYCGNSAPSVGGWDDVVVHGDLDALKFVAFYTSGNVVVSAASMGMDPYVMQTAELMRTNKMATKDMLQAGYDLLSISP